MDYKKLIEKIKWMFTHEDNFQMKKIIEEFPRDEKFLANYYNYMMLEDRGEQAPYLYHVMSPYDIISDKAPQHALVWNNGKVVLNIDYTEYADIRTGAMDTIALQLSGVKNLSNKKVVTFGTGRIAKWAVRILKESFPDLQKIDYINSKNNRDESFELFCKEIDLVANVGSKENLSIYDFISCHTSSTSAVIGKDDIRNLKKGCIITNCTSSPDSSEVADELITENADVIIDWEKNMFRAHEINKMVEKGELSKENIITLRDLLEEKRNLEDKDFTVFRFLGTPMQNLAVLKILLGE